MLLAGRQALWPPADKGHRRMIGILRHRFLAGLMVGAALLLGPAAANAIETTAKQALIVDFETGSVLYDKNGDQPVQPASMTKLMTLYILFDQLKQGKVKLDDTYTVSESAWARGESDESNMFLPLNPTVKVEDLIRGIAIQSGNDACEVVAENIAGSEADFAKLMNKKAAELGLARSEERR